MNIPWGSWLGHIKSLTRLDRRGATAIASGMIALVLIVGGIAFASQTVENNTSDALGPAKKVIQPKTSNTSSSNKSSTTPTSSRIKPQETTTTSTTTPPVTVTGVNGQAIAAPPSSTPPASTTSPTNPAQTVPGTLTPLPTSTSTPPQTNPTTPTETTPTTPHPMPNQDQPQLNVSIVGGSNPEDPFVQLDVTMSDNDGFITQVDVSWDAGETPEIIHTYEGNACSNPPPSNQALSAGHNYVLGGTHSIVVTMTTVSCDPSNTTQQAFRSVSVTSGGSGTTTTSPQDTGLLAY